MKKRNAILFLCLCLAFFLPGCSEDDFTDEETGQFSSFSDITDQESADSDITGESDKQDAFAAIDENGYCYSQLSSDEQIVYGQILSADLNRTEVSVATLSDDLLDKVFNCVLYDHPELFYIDGYQYTTRTRDDEIVAISFHANYIYDEELTAQYNEQLETAISELIANAPVDGSDYDKVRYVFDTLIINTDYVMNCRDNQNVLSVFLFHQSVCNGYAKATQLLLNRLGVESVVVNGSADGESHAWNLVKADGAWYYLDTTWGDSDFKDSRYQDANPVNYDYFMVDSATLNQTHVAQNPVALPECVAKDCNYYIHENLYISGLDPEQLQSVFDRGYESGEQTVRFKCANDAVYNDIFRYLVDEQHAFDYLDAEDSITYAVDDISNTFCFWLFN